MKELNLINKLNNMKNIKSNKKIEETNLDDSKEQRLLDTAFNLFTQKGIKDTSIQEIVDNASVAKGTFYLYFKDKYELQDVLIAKESHKLFKDALKDLRKKDITDLSDQVIFIIDSVLNKLTKNPTLLKFISKNLSWGIYSKTIRKVYEDSGEDEDGIYKLFLKGVKENNIPLKNPDVTLFMIIELVSSTCFNSILYGEPLPIDEYKPILYDTIKKLINNN